MSKDHVQLNDHASCELVRAAKPAAPADQVAPKGRFSVEHWRDGKLIATHAMDNAVTNEGRALLLNLFFATGTGTQITAYYMGLVNYSGSVVLNYTDSYANIGQSGNAWAEFTAYTDPANSNASTRPLWAPGAATLNATTPPTEQITNATAIVFDVTATGSVQGLFVCGGTAANCKTQGDHTSGNTLWSAAAFTTAPVAVQSGDQLKVSYTVMA